MNLPAWWPRLVRNAPAPSTEQTPNPYLNARRTWNDHVASQVSARALWQVVGLLSLLIAMICIAGALHLANRSTFVPYVVEVDKHGNAQAVARAAAMAPASRTVIESQLQKFVTLSRRVTTDIALQRAAVFGVYAMLSPEDPATQKMTDHLDGAEGRSPFVRAKKQTVTTEVTSVLPQTGDTWQIEWTESVYSRKGELKDRFSMRALVQVYQSDPQHRTEAALRDNPLGVYIHDYSWSRTQAREVTQ